ncbi:MAG: hypothetical protein EXR49_06960 [Dehalococcoidia bacterium]|nr:hypothetical protein [Dehalococcoidia bacterium]
MQLKDQETLNYLVNLPGINKYVLRPTVDAPLARGQIITNAARAWGVVFLMEMPALQPGMGYQVWGWTRQAWQQALGWSRRSIRLLATARYR